jgi:hypothetical protein
MGFDKDTIGQSDIESSIHNELLYKNNCYLAVANKGQKCVVEDLNSINVQQPLLWWNEGKVDRVRRDPNSPRTDHRRCQVPERENA